MVAMRLCSILVVTARIGPHAADFHLARAGGHLGRLAPLLIDVSLDHLGRQTRRQSPVLPAFKEHTHNDVRIAPRCETHKPSVLGEIFIILMFSAQRQRNNLGRAGLAGDIDSLNVRRGSRAFRQQDPAHRVGDRVPSRRVKRNAFYFRIVRGLNESLRQVRRIDHVGHNHAPSIDMAPMARISCTAVIATAPWPMPTEIVSPANHFCLKLRIFHSSEGITPLTSLGKSMPVFWPKPKAVAYLAMRSMPSFSASV